VKRHVDHSPYQKEGIVEFVLAPQHETSRPKTHH